MIVLRLNMIQIDQVINKIIKNNINRKSEKSMNKYTLFNDEANFKESLDKEINRNKEDDLLDEIMEICSADNICKFSKFEEEELKNIENIKKEIEGNDDTNLDKNTIISEFVSKEITDKVNINLSRITKQIKTNDFKIYYLQSMKKQQILNCNIHKSVEYGTKLNEMYSEQKKLQREYDDSVVQLHKFQLHNFIKYSNMISNFCKSKKLESSIESIAKKYTLEILKIFLVRKVAYLILQNFDSVCIMDIISVLENSDRFKNNFELVYDDILVNLKCGNK